MIKSILFFILIPFLFGYLFTCQKKELSILELFFMSFGIGLGVFCIISIILNLFHFPLFYCVYIILIVLLGKLFYKKIKLIKTTKYEYISLIVCLITTLIMLIGSYAYPYLEDGDPWEHAISSKYISIKMTAYQGDNNFHYIDPYPPSYDILMGVLHQLNNSIYNTLKIFNSLLIGLGIMFFYYFSKEFLKDNKKALYSTIIISLIPSFMSHFIWSQTLAIVLMFVAWYCIEKEWLYVSIIIVSAIYVTQPSVSLIFTLMTGIYWLCKTKFHSFTYTSIIYSLIGGLIVSMLWWGVMFNSYGINDTFYKMGSEPDIFTNKTSDTSDGLIYSPLDFIQARPHTKIDQPIGLSIPIFFLLLFSIYLILTNKLYKKTWVKTCLFWLVFCIIGLQGNALPFKIFPHRFWVFFVIPVSLLCSITVSYLCTNKKALIGLFIVLLLLTGSIRIRTQTAKWSTYCGIDCINETIELSKELKNYPKNTYFNTTDIRYIGLDMCNYDWCRFSK